MKFVAEWFLAFELVGFLEADGFLVAVNGNDEREADGGFGGGDGDGEDCEEDAGLGGGCDLRGVAPEGDEIEVGGVEHEFDAEEDKDGVASG